MDYNNNMLNLANNIENNINQTSVQRPVQLQPLNQQIANLNQSLPNMNQSMPTQNINPALMYNMNNPAAQMQQPQITPRQFSQQMPPQNVQNQMQVLENFETKKKYMPLLKDPIVLIILFMVLSHNKSTILTERIPFVDHYNSSSLSCLFAKGVMLVVIFNLTKKLI